MTRVEGERDNGERRERVKSKNMHEGAMEKIDTGRIGCGRWRVGRVGQSNGINMGTTVIEHQ